jgi:diguanylate cyclase (GGDEF)-like protein
MLAEMTDSISQKKQFFILIVDDDQKMRESLKELLAIYDLTSTLAKDGQEALAYLEKDYFDLILLDLHMPNIDGFQVMKAIQIYHSETDIIILSGENSFKNARKVWQLGAQDFLEKPYDPAELIDLINKIKEKRKLNSNRIASIVEKSDRSDVNNTLIEQEHMVHHDTLTGLTNRLLLMDRLDQGIKNAQRIKKDLAVFYIDLDKFKSINDALGHAAGDEVLIAVAKRLRQTVRTVDTIARIGGDEFIVLMGSISNVRDVKAMAEKLIYSLNQPIHWNNKHELYVASSIGISLAPKDGNTPEELMQKADIAMYQSKEKDGDAFQFYSA